MKCTLVVKVASYVQLQISLLVISVPELSLEKFRPIIQMKHY